MRMRRKCELVVSPENETVLTVIFRIREAQEYPEKVPLNSESDGDVPQDANSNA